MSRQIKALLSSLLALCCLFAVVTNYKSTVAEQREQARQECMEAWNAGYLAGVKSGRDSSASPALGLPQIPQDVCASRQVKGLGK